MRNEPQPRQLSGGFPLSHAQRRLWRSMRTRRTPGHDCSERVALRLRGPLNEAALVRAIEAMFERHDVLRVHLTGESDEPVQVIAETCHKPVVIEDVTGLSERLRLERVRYALREERDAFIDPFSEPLARVRLLKLAADDHVLLRHMHRLVWDGASDAIWNRELTAFYRACCDGHSPAADGLPVQYADYVRAQRDRSGHHSLSPPLDHSPTQLGDVSGHSSLLRRRPAWLSYGLPAGAYQSHINDDVFVAVRRVAGACGLTEQVPLLAALAAVVARYGTDNDIILGTVVSDRTDTRLSGLIGLFEDYASLRVQVSPTTTLGALLDEVRRIVLNGSQHPDAPPDVQMLFSFPSRPAVPPDLPGVDVTFVAQPERSIEFDLEVRAWDTSDALTVQWLYNTDFMDHACLSHLAWSYERVLGAMCSTPETQLEQIDVMDESEQRRVIDHWGRADDRVPALSRI